MLVPRRVIPTHEFSGDLGEDTLTKPQVEGDYSAEEGRYNLPSPDMFDCTGIIPAHYQLPYLKCFVHQVYPPQK